MEIVKKTDKYTIIKKRSGRYGIKASSGAWVNGPEKVQILVQEKLLEVPVPKAKEKKEDATDAAPAESEKK